MLYLCFFQLGITKVIPDKYNTVRYDADWFDDIRVSGYIYVKNQMSNMAFFPLFPYAWKWSGLNGLQMSFLNLIIYIIAYVLLMGKAQYKVLYLMIISSIPCFIFFFLPYSEAWFFLFGTLLIVGYRKDSRALQVIGLVGCCLTRSVSIFFLPAIIITELLAYKKSPSNKKKVLGNILINSLASLSSILIVVIVQGIQTGKWFYYIEVQKYWQRHWIIPSFPVTTISPAKVLGIDAIAMVLGIIAIFFMLKWAYFYLKKFSVEKKKDEGHQQICKSVYFSTLFLSAIVIVDTCFTYNIDGKTNIQCMNRHLMCTAFAVCFLNWIYKHYNAKVIDGYLISFILVCGIFVTGIYSYSYHLIYYILFCSSFFLYKYFPKLELAFIVLFFFNIFFTVIFYQDFISGFWIG
jgi:hypothetical protein